MLPPLPGDVPISPHFTTWIGKRREGWRRKWVQTKPIKHHNTLAYLSSPRLFSNSGSGRGERRAVQVSGWIKVGFPTHGVYPQGIHSQTFHEYQIELVIKSMGWPQQQTKSASQKHPGGLLRQREARCLSHLRGPWSFLDMGSAPTWMKSTGAEPTD